MNKARLVGLAVAALSCAPLLAGPDPSQPRQAPSSNLLRPLSIDISERPLKETLSLIQDAAGVRLQPLWLDDKNHAGLDPELPVSIKADQESLTTILERLLESIEIDQADASTWQLSSTGVIQLGPRSRLNAFKRIEIYDIADLLKIAPDHRRGPVIDLQQAIQGSGVPLSRTEEGDDWLIQSPEPRQRAEELATLIRDLVETEQWEENGGEGGTIRPHDRTLIVKAPGYIHRAIAGP